ncbi:MAG: hypothetical protein HQ478_12085 [Chloroflexi bacterium]|nr:hypothetical protein [Chloroflexota bacterium]
MQLNIERIKQNPIIVPHMDDRMGGNINGPSLIKVPDWVENPLGRYYLYFGHHRGTYIRLAFADSPDGPYTMVKPGVLDVDNSHFVHHIASPDVHLDHDLQRFIMYYHGRVREGDHMQASRVAVSADGIRFSASPEILGAPYFRVFEHADYFYAIGMPGIVYRSNDRTTGFTEGPTIFPDNARHVAVLIRGTKLYLFHTMVGDVPESIMVGEIDLSTDWMDWEVRNARELIRPVHDWEGANQPLVPSARGPIEYPVNQLRDPCVFEDGDEAYLLYAVAGEQGIAIARMDM